MDANRSRLFSDLATISNCTRIDNPYFGTAMITILPTTGGVKVMGNQCDLQAASKALQRAGISFEPNPYSITVPCPTAPHNAIYRNVITVLSEVSDEPF